MFHGGGARTGPDPGTMHTGPSVPLLATPGRVGSGRGQSPSPRHHPEPDLDGGIGVADFRAPRLGDLLNPRDRMVLRMKRVNLPSNIGVYFRAPFHTFLHLPIWLFCSLFVLLYLGNYFFFAVVYMLLGPKEAIDAANDNPCIMNVETFEDAFFLSAQTASTVGYGYMAPDPDCLRGNIAVTTQSIFSALLDLTMLGLAYAKFSTPTSRASSIRFSKNIGIYRKVDHDGHPSHLSLFCRVANTHFSHLLDSEVRMMLVMHRGRPHEAHLDSKERVRDVELKPLECGVEAAALALGLPATIEHVIDEDSPLFEKTMMDMCNRGVYIMVTFKATDMMTSSTIEQRQMYEVADMEPVCVSDVPLSITRKGSRELQVNFSWITHSFRGGDLHNAFVRLQSYVEFMSRFAALNANLAVPRSPSAALPRPGSGHGFGFASGGHIPHGAAPTGPFHTMDQPRPEIDSAPPALGPGLGSTHSERSMHMGERGMSMGGDRGMSMGADRGMSMGGDRGMSMGGDRGMSMGGGGSGQPNGDRDPYMISGTVPPVATGRDTRDARVQPPMGRGLVGHMDSQRRPGTYPAHDDRAYDDFL